MNCGPGLTTNQKSAFKQISCSVTQSSHFNSLYLLETKFII